MWLPAVMNMFVSLVLGLLAVQGRDRRCEVLVLADGRDAREARSRTGALPVPALDLVRHGSEPSTSGSSSGAPRRPSGGDGAQGHHGAPPDGSIVRESTWALAHEVPVIVEIVDGPGGRGGAARPRRTGHQRAARSRWNGRTSCSIGAAGRSGRTVAAEVDVIATRDSECGMGGEDHEAPRARRPAPDLHRGERPGARRATGHSTRRSSARTRGASGGRDGPDGPDGLREALADALRPSCSSSRPTFRS